MATTWDWSPVAQGLQGLIGNYVQQKQYNDLLQNLLGPGVGTPTPQPAQGLIGRLLHPQSQQQAQPQSVAQAAPMQMPNPEDIQASSTQMQPQNMVGMRTPQNAQGGGLKEILARALGQMQPIPNQVGPAPTPEQIPNYTPGTAQMEQAGNRAGGGSPLGGIDPRMADLLRRLPPQIGMPLLLQTMQNQMQPHGIKEIDPAKDLYDDTGKLIRKGVPAGKYGTRAQAGINPDTGKPDQFVVDEQGNTRWLGSGVIPKDDAETQAHKDATNLGLKPGTPEYNQYIRERTLPKPASTNVTVNAGNSLASGIGSGGADILKASQAAASGAVDTISTGNQIRDALASGKVMAGPGTTALMWMRQLSGGNQETLNQTRTVIQGLAKYALAGRGQLKGQGQISDYEGKLLQKAAGGDIDNMSIGELKTLTDLNERVARASIAKHKQVIEKTGKAGIPPEYLSIYGVDEPPPYGSASGGAQIPTVSSPAEARKLPSGTHFKTPDGRELVVP